MSGRTRRAHTRRVKAKTADDANAAAQSLRLVLAEVDTGRIVDGTEGRSIVRHLQGAIGALEAVARNSDRD